MQQDGNWDAVAVVFYMTKDNFMVGHGPLEGMLEIASKIKGDWKLVPFLPEIHSANMLNQIVNDELAARMLCNHQDFELMKNGEMN